MARHDFRCPACGYVREVNVPVTVGASQAEVYHEDCFESLDDRERMVPIPAAPAMDFGPSGGTGFKGFSITEEVNGRLEHIQIDSLSALRKVERESEQRARNGEGRPLIWRDYNQDRSNGDVHTMAKDLGDPHGVAPTVAAATAAKKVTPRRGEAVTKAHGTL